MALTLQPARNYVFSVPTLLAAGWYYPEGGARGNRVLVTRPGVLLDSTKIWELVGTFDRSDCLFASAN